MWNPVIVQVFLSQHRKKYRCQMYRRDFELEAIPDTEALTDNNFALFRWHELGRFKCRNRCFFTPQITHCNDFDDFLPIFCDVPVFLIATRKNLQFHCTDGKIS